MRTFTEYVLPGHPDKISDRIADRIVEEALKRDKWAIVGIEVGVNRDHVFVDGRIMCPDVDTIDFDSNVREVFCESGYSDEFPPNPENLCIVSDLYLRDFKPDERNVRKMTADQNIVTGYAEFNPKCNHMPLAHFVARTIALNLEKARKRSSDKFGPDGKVLVVVNGKNGKHELRAVSLSIYHKIDISTVEIYSFGREVLKDSIEGLCEVVEEFSPAEIELVVNGAGDFVKGGPDGDNGLSGKKLVVDAYGPSIPIGGGALSGKDPHHVDKILALRARQVAKHLVMSGIAQRVLVYLASAPGDNEPRWKEIRFGEINYEKDEILWRVADQEFASRWLSGYDLSIEGTFEDLNLCAVGWRELAAWGHFWDSSLPWERWNPGHP